MIIKKEKLFDSLFLSILVLVYTIIAFINLGDNVAPQTFYRLGFRKSIAILLPREVINPRVVFYTGITENDFSLKYKYLISDRPESSESIANSSRINPNDLSDIFESHIDGPFRWRSITTNSKTSLIIINNYAGRDIDLGELAVFGDNERIDAKLYNYSESGGLLLSDDLSALTDEQNTIQTKQSILNSSYFDELYFAQTAYQYATGQRGYETVHPPLGKLLQSIPIAITGRMTPFTWRVGGAIAGVFIIIATYFLAEQIFKKKSFARLSATLVSLSGLHFVQTRVGTVDSYLCLFTVLSYLFMLKFFDKEQLRFFVLSGLFFGCAFAVKWSGAFIGIGLAILFFNYIWRKKRQKLFSWVLKGFLCFVIIPALIYSSCYLFFSKTTQAQTPQEVIGQSSWIFTYHANEHTPHPYSSKWYTWPLALKPMLYSWEDNGKSVLYLLGNYVIAYVSVIGLIITAFFGFKQKNKESIYIIVAWLSLLLPYAFISRPMFLYHYLPASIFAILALSNIFYLIPGTRKIIPYYILMATIAFITIYPKMVGL